MADRPSLHAVRARRARAAGVGICGGLIGSVTAARRGPGRVGDGWARIVLCARRGAGRREARTHRPRRQRGSCRTDQCGGRGGEGMVGSWGLSCVTDAGGFAICAAESVGDFDIR